MKTNKYETTNKSFVQHREVGVFESRYPNYTISGYFSDTQIGFLESGYFLTPMILPKNKQHTTWTLFQSTL